MAKPTRYNDEHSLEVSYANWFSGYKLTHQFNIHVFLYKP